MRRHRTNLRPDSRRNHEHGIVIMLVAVVMLGVVGAMAALSIDVVTLYTARSEAQLAADSAALAGARVLANSGLTSTTTGPAGAEDLARTIATQVAANNEVGGRNLNTTGTSACTAGQEICVSFNDGDSAFVTDPHVTVRVQRTDLPTFFARIWGSKQITVAASATAEAYNPSGAEALDLDPPPQVAPTCVKPWLLPNIDPTGTEQIFDPQTGAMNPDLPDLLGKSWSLQARCQDCSSGDDLPQPVAGQYYPGAIEADDFPAPTKALPTCSADFNSYQLAVAGCVRRPIRCGANAKIDIDVNAYPAAPGRDLDTFQAASCLIHYNGATGDSDSVDSAAPPFQFRAGKQNRVANAVGNNDVLVSDSLVTIPVINTTADQNPNTTVGVIGFLQVFVNPTGAVMPGPSIPVKIINLTGCGTNASGQPILGNGASPVAVRLISPP